MPTTWENLVQTPLALLLPLSSALSAPDTPAGFVPEMTRATRVYILSVSRPYVAVALCSVSVGTTLARAIVSSRMRIHSRPPGRYPTPVMTETRHRGHCPSHMSPRRTASPA